MGLPSKTQAEFVTAMVSSWATSLGFTPTLQQNGDALFTLMESVASQLVFVQAQVQLVNALARAQTTGSDLNNGTTDADLDSFYAQFGFTRLPAQAAEGPLVIGKNSPATVAIQYPVGMVVQTIGGAVQYALVADTNQPTFNASLNAYVLAIGQNSLTATAQALVAGSASNVTIGQLAQVATPVAGADTVTNLEPISNGTDAEPNPSFRARFVNFLNSRSKATFGAIVSAITGVQQGIEYQLEENVSVNGSYYPGEFVASIDNGTGSPPASLLAAVFAAVDAVRGFTIMPAVIADTTINTTVSIAIRLASGFTLGTVEAAVANAIVTQINSTDIGAALSADTIITAALSVPGVASVQISTLLLNGVNADLPAVVFSAYRSNINLVTVGSY